MLVAALLCRSKTCSKQLIMFIIIIDTYRLLGVRQPRLLPRCDLAQSCQVPQYRRRSATGQIRLSMKISRACCLELGSLVMLPCRRYCTPAFVYVV